MGVGDKLRIGVELDVASHNDIKAIMEKSADAALFAHPQGSFAHVFWQQQLEAASTAKASQRRWHPFDDQMDPLPTCTSSFWENVRYYFVI